MTTTLERQSLLRHARSIIDTAKAADRDLSDAEHQLVEADLSNVEQMDAQAKARNRRVFDLGLGPTDPNTHAGADVATLFTDEQKSGLVGAVKSRGMFRTELAVKAALTSGTMLPPTGTGVIGGTYPSAAFPLSQLFAVEPTESPVTRYYVLGGATAGTVAEGAPKPDSGVTVTAKDVTLSKLATTCRFSDELSEDAAFLIAYLQAELTNAVIVTENGAIITALGAASGISTATGTLVSVIDLAATVIASMTALNGAPPAAFIVHPNVLASIRTSKASTSGTYFVDPTADVPQSLHGVQLVPSMATVPGTAYMVGSGAAVVYRRSQITAEINWNADDFQTNQRTMRVEERMAVGVVRPSQVTKLTLT